MLKETGNPYSIQTCAAVLGHPSSEVRIYALRILAEIGDQTILPSVLSITSSSSFRGSKVDEKVEAIRVIGSFGASNELEHIRKLASRRFLFGGKRYERIGTAAKTALADIQKRTGVPDVKCA